MSALVGAVTLSGVIFWAVYTGRDASADEFFRSVKGDLFNGLFTLAGLLLTLKTYIVVALQTGIYAKPGYIETFVKAKDQKKVSYESHLDPLENLSNALSWAVAVTALAAIAQLIAASLPIPLRIFTGFPCAGAALGSLVFCWFQMRRNLRIYFNFRKEEAEPDVVAARRALEIRNRDFTLEEAKKTDNPVETDPE